MRYSLVPALAGLAAAVPVAERQSGPTDAQILNYALTLEHLEDTFYSQAVSKFTSADFENLGLSSSFYTNLKEIASDEQTHVSFLTSALQAAGANATAACTYNFGYTDAAGFLATAALLEGVGVSAYLGAAQFIANKAYLTYAGSILTVESRHSAYLRESQRPLANSPFPSPFDIPLDLDEVYSLASLFITGCPSTNPTLPVKAFPALTVGTTGQIQPNQTITLTVAKPVAAKGAFFITTTGPVAASLTGNGTSYSVVVPAKVQAGQEYLVLTSGTESPTDDNIVAGPAVVPIADYLATASTGTSSGSGSGSGSSSSGSVGSATATATGTVSTGTAAVGGSGSGSGSSTMGTATTTAVGVGSTSTGTSSNSTVSPANGGPSPTVVPSTQNAAPQLAGFHTGALAVAAVLAIFFC